MKLRAFAVVLLALVLLPGALGASQDSSVLYEHGADAAGEYCPKLYDYLWDGSALFLRDADGQAALFLDKPDKLVRLPQDAAGEETHYIVLPLADGRHIPYYLKYLKGSRRVALVELLPDLSTQISISWSIAETEYRPDEDYHYYLDTVTGPPVIRIRRWDVNAWKMVYEVEVPALGLTGLYGPLESRDARFEARFDKLELTVDNFAEKAYQAQLLTIDRKRDGRRFRIEVRDGEVRYVRFHPTLDWAAVVREPRLVREYPRGSRTPPGARWHNQNISDWNGTKIDVYDLSGMKPRKVSCAVRFGSDLRWDRLRPLLWMRAEIYAERALSGYFSWRKPWDLPPEPIPATYLEYKRSAGFLAWNVEKDEYSIIRSFMDDSPDSRQFNVVPLPDGRIARHYPKEITVGGTSGVVPDRGSTGVFREVLGREEKRLAALLAEKEIPGTVFDEKGEPPPHVYPEFHIVQPTEPTKEDPGYRLWSPIQLQDQNLFMINTFYLEPGEIPSSSALDCDFYIIDWDLNVIRHHEFPRIRGTWQIREISDEGFRFERWRLPEEGERKPGGYEGDRSFWFNNRGEYLRDEPVLPRALKPRFKQDKIEGSRRQAPRLRELYFVDEEQVKHSFREAAGIEGEVAFISLTGFGLPGSFYDDWWTAHPLIVVASYPFTDELPLMADWYIWDVRDGRARKVWTGIPASLSFNSGGQFYHYDPEGDTLTMLRVTEPSPYVSGLHGSFNGLFWGGTLNEKDDSELVRIDLSTGAERTLVSGNIRSVVFNEDQPFVIGKLGGDDQVDVWSVSAEGVLRRLTNTPEEEQRLKIWDGMIDVNLKGDESNFYRWRVDLDTLKRRELPKELQGG